MNIFYELLAYFITAAIISFAFERYSSTFTSGWIAGLIYSGLSYWIHTKLLMETRQ